MPGVSQRVNSFPRWRLVFRQRPFMSRQQLSKKGAPLVPQHNNSVEVRRINLPDEFSTAPAGRQHIQLALIVSPHCHDRGNLIFARGHHGSNRAVLGTEPRAAACVDANPAEPVTSFGDKRRGDIAEEAVANAMRP
jgi:hypothetical protein